MCRVSWGKQLFFSLYSFGISMKICTYIGVKVKQKMNYMKEFQDCDRYVDGVTLFISAVAMWSFLLIFQCVLFIAALPHNLACSDLDPITTDVFIYIYFIYYSILAQNFGSDKKRLPYRPHMGKRLAQMEFPGINFLKSFCMKNM